MRPSITWIMLVKCCLAHQAMYVWRDAFDVDAAPCKGIYPENQDGINSSCFRHSWETRQARQRLLAASALSSREVSRIFLSDIRNRVRHGDGKNSNGACDPNLVAMLSQAHLLGIEVYALFSSSDAEFSEQFMVQDLNLFNTNCGTSSVFFDGASINNEYFTSIKSCTAENVPAQQTFLNNLEKARANASPLPLHFSVSWNWGCCNCSSDDYSESKIQWSGATKSALHHMIDIADSVDVQVAWNEGSTMARRASNAYNYWNTNKQGQTQTTAFYVLAYTNPNSDCRQSFCPHAKGASVVPDTCTVGNRTEEGMFAAFDEVRGILSHASGAIHFLGGAYSTGMPGWPRHDPTVASTSRNCQEITERLSCSQEEICDWTGNGQHEACVPLQTENPGVTEWGTSSVARYCLQVVSILQLCGILANSGFGE